MKVFHVIPPALSLVLVIAWNLRSQGSIREMEARNRELRSGIKAAGLGPQGEARGDGMRRRPVKSRAATLDWKAIAVKAGKGAESVDLKSMLEWSRQIEGMSDLEILEALDGMDAMALDDRQREALEDLLIDPLIEKNPQLALERFADRIGKDDDNIGWRLSTAMAGWVKADSTAAMAWFDRQIAAGTFDSRTLDGRSEARIEFEGALAGELLGSSDALVARRISALPEEQRREALEQISFSELSPAARDAYVGLVRGLVPADERDGSFSHMVADLAEESGFGEVDAFLNRVNATPEERLVSAKEAANTRLGMIAEDREVTAGDVDAMRAWVEKQAPGTTDRVTGEALGDAAQDGGEFNFDAASKLALEYHRRSGGDEVLAAFLESFAARSNSEQALPLLDQIRDPKLRDRLRDSLQ